MSMKYTFEWKSTSANEVYVTGSFDNWSRSVKLVKDGDTFSRSITLPSEKIYFKFVVDGDWVLAEGMKSEADSAGIVNNVLVPEDLEESLQRTKTHETGVSQFTSISYPNKTSESPAMVDADVDNMSSSTQVTLEDGAGGSSITVGESSQKSRKSGVFSRFRSFFK